MFDQNPRSYNNSHWLLSVYALLDQSNMQNMQNELIYFYLNGKSNMCNFYGMRK